MLVPIYTLREHLTCFSNVKGIKFLTLELVHQIGGFIANKLGDEISQVGVRVSE